MALSVINNSSNTMTLLSRISHPALSVNAFLNEVQYTRYAIVYQNRMKNFHITSVRRYPDPPVLPLPTNVSEIFANETGRFTPERARDISAPVLLYGKNDCKSFFSQQSAKLMERSNSLKGCSDTHVDSYDCFGAVSLNGTMQSNVPKPFSSNGKSTHLNMPGGQWARDEKYIAEDMQKSHYRSVRLPQLKLDKSGLTSYVGTNTLFQSMYNTKYMYSTGYSIKSSSARNNGLNFNDKKQQMKELKKERFRQVMKEYGLIVAVFHVGISLISLGACYAAVANGLDIAPLIQYMYTIENEGIQKIVNQSSVFLIAYGFHKLMAPIRMALSLGMTPLIVRYLRKVGMLKSPKKVTAK